MKKTPRENQILSRRDIQPFFVAGRITELILTNGVEWVMDLDKIIRRIK